MALGFSFDPTAANETDRQNSGNRSQAPQGAIQTINYQLPRVAGAASLSPLVGLGSGSPFSGAVLQAVLKTLLGPDHESLMSGGFDATGGGGQGAMNPFGGQQDNGAAVLNSFAGQSGGGSAPPPTIIPGGEGYTPTPPRGPDSGQGSRESVLPAGVDGDRSNPGPGNRHEDVGAPVFEKRPDDTAPVFTPQGRERNQNVLNKGGGGYSSPIFG